MTRQTVLESALQLSAEDREAVALELLHSTEGELLTEDEWLAAWRPELERRLNALDDGTAQTIPWERVKAELRAKTDAQKG